ncbi:MAG: acyl-ACP--UDP-N-acetylglucosamine O-acyltransferase [Planctomycetes bacterium]|nr:acyl-ACP--UDP-N-acetylglucosamine O-acyltransferase [Planctomycetota bacterium]
MAIHPLAVVDSQATVHPDATIGPFCCVQGHVTIGQGAELRNHVTVYGRSTIGARTILFPGCVIGSDPQDLKFRGEDSETVIGSDCRIHEFVTVSKGTAGGGMKTIIGDATLVMAYAHIAHDCILADHVVIGNNSQLAGHVKVGRKAVISGMIGVHHFASIGELSFVGAMSGVRFDIPPFMIAEGNPAEPRNINQVGMRRDGWSEEHIRAVKDAFRVLYHDRGNKALSQAVADFRATMPTDATHPVNRLVTWISDHLETSVRGRVQEATRQPAAGLRTSLPAAQAQA